MASRKINYPINIVLQKRFLSLDNLGKVYLDDRLIECPIPSQQRSASTDFRAARGTRIPFGKEKDTLRFFTYWVGNDII